LESGVEIKSEYLSGLNEIKRVVMPCKVASLSFPFEDVSITIVTLTDDEQAKMYSAMGLLFVLGFAFFQMTQVVFNHHVTTLFYVVCVCFMDKFNFIQ